MNRRLWIVCYDIGEAKRLRRVAKVMARFGTRAQKSVFECWLTESLFDEMLQTVERELEPRTDSIRAYALCKDCLCLTEEQGKTSVHRAQQYYIV